METIIGSIERVLSSVTALVCAAVAVVAYIVRDVVPLDWQWVTVVVMWLFGAVALAKTLENALRAGRRAWISRRASKRREQRRADEKAKTQEEERQKLEQREASRLAVLKRLEFLADDEILLIASALRSRSQTIQISLSSPTARALSSKGILANAGGLGEEDNWPWTFRDFIWEHLIERSNEFQQRAEKVNLRPR
ncbi:hypothetical protein [Elioraea sp.]|uniref:hypothetical protein n=1 Tax=Elioraea sp. TaxID=2185103 RepID=UPI0025BEC3AC|nr:hypothetical protein [Elioraea sp.]